MDGGICSQMHFYIIGETLRRRGNEIRYDLRWFRECGTDLDGRFCRNFDILKLFPDLKIEEERSAFARRVYTSLFYKRNNYFATETDATAWEQYGAPMYLDGYFRDDDEMYGELFTELFRPDETALDEANRRMLDKITVSEAETCAIHVRRGDLSKFNSAYGNPADMEYFRNALHHVLKEADSRQKSVKFYLFSDEPEWCRENLLPILASGDVEICDINGSDRGYCDLLLMSRCRHQITSQGSMGKYAALLRRPDMRNGLVTLPPNANSDEWLSRFRRAVVIAD